MQCPFSPYRFTSHNFLSFQAFVSNSKSYSYVLNMRLRSTFHGQRMSDRKKTIVIYVCSIWVLMLGISYAGVPLYRLFCQVRHGMCDILIYFISVFVVFDLNTDFY